uniref:Copia protein n=1 Tax=Kalanchoe fedtschenkoi TaxID=63787 RepID=A0A7N0UHT5_KALFE
IYYKRRGICELNDTCDVDYTGEHDTRRSIMGYAFNLVSCVKLLEDLYRPVNNVVNLYCDTNKSTIWLVENPFFHARTKHVKVHYHYKQDKVLLGDIKMKHITTGNQVVDIFTKDLNGVKFEELRRKFGMISSAALEESCR